MSKKYIGIDQSFRGCAVVVLDEFNNLIDFAIKKTSKTDGDMFTRADIMSKFLVDFISKYPDNILGLEGLAFGGFGNATRDLAGLQFTIILALRKLGIQESIFSAKTIKKFASSTGTASKTIMIDALPESIKRAFSDAGFKKTTGLADLADAYWIARIQNPNVTIDSNLTI